MTIDKIYLTSASSAGQSVVNYAMALMSKVTISLDDQGGEASRQTETIEDSAFIEIRPKRPLPTVTQAMLASEDVLRREWDTPEEDAAWANL